MNKIVLLIVLIFVMSCQEEKKQNTLKIGSYRATLAIKDSLQLPFIFEVTSPRSLTIFNADERIEVDEIIYKNDSVIIHTPVFEGFLVAAIANNNLKGSFIKKALNRVVPFNAEFDNTKRFTPKQAAMYNVSGNWEVTFSKGDEDNEYKAKGIFKQSGSRITGTFRTTTGDYRYLEGVIDGNDMKLSTFDGAHAFLFTAKVSDTNMKGTFYSGNHYKAPFEAIKNSNFELQNANTLTYLKDGYNKFAFSFPDETGQLISLEDEQFKNKVIVVQIMGSWCPNCLDESKYYANFYNTHKSKDIAFVALAFEYAKTKEKAFASIQRLKDKLKIEYPILLAQYGTTSKIKAQEKLPMLNQVLSYPTSIFIDKKGKVRKIHTGFNGPATGHKYLAFKKEFETFIAQLLAE